MNNVSAEANGVEGEEVYNSHLWHRRGITCYANGPVAGEKPNRVSGHLVCHGLRDRIARRRMDGVNVEMSALLPKIIGSDPALKEPGGFAGQGDRRLPRRIQARQRKARAQRGLSDAA